MDSLIHQRDYAKRLRPELPPEAFDPDPSKLYILLINVAILGCGWGLGAQLHTWPVQWLWLYLPFALVMANSVTVLAFGSHDLQHGSVIRKRRLAHYLAIILQTPLWMSATLWRIVHNRIHHNQTNQPGDPDRNYYFQEPNTIGKRVQAWLFPSAHMTRPWLALSLLSTWGFYVLRHTLSVLIWNGQNGALSTATFRVTPEERRAIAGELALMAGLHLGVLAWLSFDPLQVAIAYVLPLALGHAGMMAYIYTNHLVSPITEINDPLVNSLSLRVPKLFDVLHLHFSHHAEHHIFPGLNSDYYPLVRELLSKHYPDRTAYVVDAAEAWKMLLSTPCLYLDAVTLTDWQGNARSPCHLSVPLTGTLTHRV